MVRKQINKLNTTFQHNRNTSVHTDSERDAVVV